MAYTQEDAWINHCIAEADDRAREVNSEYDNTHGEEAN